MGWPESQKFDSLEQWLVKCGAGTWGFLEDGSNPHRPATLCELSSELNWFLEIKAVGGALIALGVSMEWRMTCITSQHTAR